MVRAPCSFAVIASVILFVLGTPAGAKDPEPDHIRGQITKVEASSIEVKTNEGKTVRLRLSDNVTIFSLSKAQFTDLNFGTYVGSIARRLDAYSPIVRDSMSWLHEGYELRIMDEKLRGIAVGHKPWDLTPESTMSHGWVDDIEGRVISIKYGPTEEEETDVEVPRNVPILKMSLGDRSLIKPDAYIFAGARKGADGNYMAVFIFFGTGDIRPPL